MILCARLRVKIIAGIAIGLAAIIAFCCIVASCGTRLDFNATFYYVCYDAPQDAQSVSAVSCVVKDYGGAGYIITCNGQSFVTVACYYEYNHAQSVSEALKNKGVQCSVIAEKVEKLKVKGRAAKFAERYSGNLNTLLSISKICYELANVLDVNACGQSTARQVLYNVKEQLSGLLKANAGNCFSVMLSELVDECADVCSGYVYSHEVRRLQIAICDGIVNISLY